MTLLRGMTWNHIRGYGPLLATTDQFQKLYPDVSIQWDRRSLKDFGDFPLDQLANEYDIVMIDHPHVGISSDQGILVPLEQWLHKDFVDNQMKNSVGPSFKSYQWMGHLWALPVDAAAQVSAYRADLLYGSAVPKTWEQVFNLTAHLPPCVKIGIPLCPTDLICSFFSLCANIGGDTFFDELHGIDLEAGVAAIEHLQKLLPLLHPKSLDWNPIQMLDHMASTNEIAYVALCFGYSNYSRTGFKTNPIYFTNIPSFNEIPNGSILGGVGLAVSSFSKHVQESVRYAEYVASEEIQRTLYFMEGGQPGHRSAWVHQDVNKESRHFFENTLMTLDLSYMRPRYKHFPIFQEEAGSRLHRLLTTGVSARDTISKLNDLYKAVKKKFPYV